MFTLWSGPECVLLHQETGKALQFDAEGNPSAVNATSGSGKRVAAFLGVVHLNSAYLVVSRSRAYAGDLLGHKVYALSEFELVSCDKRAESPVDYEYKSLLLMHLRSAPLYLSETWDLTASFQGGLNAGSQSANPSGHPSDRFWWNYEAMQPIVPFGEPFVQKVIFGVFSVRNATLNGTSIQFGLITRRSRLRAGTRYFRRGIDAQGNVANFNETEQVLVVKGQVYSYLQTRGSVPVFWGEVNRMKYRPLLRIGGDSLDAAQKHFAEQKALYGTQYLVNLVNQSGYEKPVKDAYEETVRRLNDPSINYVYFDFHHECSKMRWHRVFLLLEELVKLGLNDQLWYQASGDKVVRTQTSVVRTNCMDCLDRTNVVQSCLGGWTLQKQLEDAQVLQPGQKWDADKQFEAVFRAAWGDNADAVSFAYSGTGALKTDFTRTGKRTKLGALKDLKNSIARFYLNNLRDGPRQDGFNLWLGDYKPREAVSNPFVDLRSLWVQAVPWCMAFGAIVFVISVLYPSRAHSKTFNVGISLASLLIAGGCYQKIVADGLQYVNWPKLLPTDFVETGSDSRVVERKRGGSLKLD